ncbi:hypothetical protein E8E13_000465 [Curvularia kusanoi]|uniref:Uncharacterized protein n=1 Tax=Curvularia kusanoi TaxID=90978 RepID=A0A9P4TC42_CURKU|nr:hypothetical protein E8E13_000465 [Curvularia kusanoi]
MSEHSKWRDHTAPTHDHEYMLDSYDHDQPKSASDNLAFCYADKERHHQDNILQQNQSRSFQANSATTIEQARELETPPIFIETPDSLASIRRAARVSMPLGELSASPPPSLEVPPPPPNSPAATAYAYHATLPTSPLLPVLPLLAEAYSRNGRNSLRQRSTSKKALFRYSHTAETKHYGNTRPMSMSSNQGKQTLERTIQLVHRSRRQQRGSL